MSYRFGLIGFPVQHSLSPWIHNQFLKRSHLLGQYELIEIKPNESFAFKMSELRQHELDGFNVTVPYKETIIPYLDRLDKSAETIGAVNTVLHDNGKWIGYNTDGIGYIRSLESEYPNLFLNKSKKVLIIGAGGAAKGIYYALITSGFSNIDLANRTVNNANEIAKLKGNTTSTSTLSIEEAEQLMSCYDVIIQTTSVGMKPNENHSIASLDQLKPSSIVSDIVYQPIMTKFLKTASNKAFIHYGHTMLLYQAQYAFEIWTNKKVPIDNLAEQLKLILKGS